MKTLFLILFTLLIHGCSDVNTKTNLDDSILEAENEPDNSNNTNVFELKNIDNSYTSLVTKDNVLLIGGDKDLNVVTTNQRSRSYGFKKPQFKSKSTEGIQSRSNTNKEVRIYSLLEQNDGKIIVAGNFGSINDYKSDSLIRLNIDGTIDSTFESVDKFSGEIYALELLNDNSILIGGYFKNIKGQSASGIIKLTSDGKVDSLFHNTLSKFDMSIINNIKVIDEIIYLGGTFINIVDDEAVMLPLMSIDKFGNLNKSFNEKVSNIRGEIFKIIHHDNNIIAVGDFTYNNETKNIIQLSTSGDIDNNFKLANNLQGTLFDVAYIDNKLLIAGDFILDDTLTKGFAIYEDNKLISSSKININADVYGINVYKDSIILTGEGNYTIKQKTYANSVMLNLTHFEE